MGRHVTSVMGAQVSDIVRVSETSDWVHVHVTFPRSDPMGRLFRLRDTAAYFGRDRAWYGPDGVSVEKGTFHDFLRTAWLRWDGGREPAVLW